MEIEARLPHGHDARFPGQRRQLLPLDREPVGVVRMQSDGGVHVGVGGGERHRGA